MSQYSVLILTESSLKYGSLRYSESSCLLDNCPFSLETETVLDTAHTCISEAVAAFGGAAVVPQIA